MNAKQLLTYLFIISSFSFSQNAAEKDSTIAVQTTSQTVEDTTQAVVDTSQVVPDQIKKISTMVLANRITNVSGFERMIIGDLLGDEMMETSAASMVIKHWVPLLIQIVFLIHVQFPLVSLLIYPM